MVLIYFLAYKTSETPHPHRSNMQSSFFPISSNRRLFAIANSGEIKKMDFEKVVKYGIEATYLSLETSENHFERKGMEIQEKRKKVGKKAERKKVGPPIAFGMPWPVPAPACNHPKSHG